MGEVGQREIQTQLRVVAFFREVLGYNYHGHWQDRADNGNVENALLTDWLKRQGHDDKIITKVLRELSKAAALGGSKTLQARIDEWFDNKTRGLTDVAKAQLKQRWGTMQRILSARDRLEKIVADILFDMETRERLKSGRGNAMLVSGSIYSACRFFEMFRQIDLAGKCAIVTSYRPATADIKGEETGEGLTEKLRQYDR